ncbi:hypothetical protein OJAV_G00186420 [Oryzias javanicus]|uniref:Uncharacterized protein n=1 Tax=Oryzias javanicus TaxID=123683 RepID=A0A437C953_ORYJA|nr:hypothetical protein OJAV_G00186420 [Oryzias javanicus]
MTRSMLQTSAPESRTETASVSRISAPAAFTSIWSCSRPSSEETTSHSSSRNFSSFSNKLSFQSSTACRT